MSKQLESDRASDDANCSVSLWMPIQTVPKDGTRILVWDESNSPEECVIAKWGGHPSGDPCLVDEEYFCVTRATHWMPLPTPPQNETSPSVDATEK